MDDQDRQACYRQRMRRKQTVIEAAIKNAEQEWGVLLALTGNGKGRSSSAFGMVARAPGHGMKVGVAQFVKGRDDTGEVRFFRRQPGVTWHILGEGFTWTTQDLARTVRTVRQGWALACELLCDPALDLVVLDELTHLLKHDWLETEVVVAEIRARPPKQHVVITGRGLPPALRKVADTLTEMRDVKPAFRACREQINCPEL